MTEYNPHLTLDDIVRQRLHHGTSRFSNPLARQPRHSFFQVIRWKLFTKNHFKADYLDEPKRSITIDWVPVLNHSGVSVTFVNHACLFISAGKTRALIDPIFFGLPGFIEDFTPLRFNGRPVPDPDLILITHGHYDHLDKKSLAAFGREQQVVTPLGYEGVFESLDMRRRTQLDWFEDHCQGDMKITLLPANHWTMRSPLEGPNTSLWGSYIIETAQGPTIYVSGDTAYFHQFAEIGQRFDIDLAILNLGAYEPRWFMAQSHMNPQEAAKAFQDLAAKKLMAVHWGTFRLGDEPVHFPPRTLAEVMTERGLLDRLLTVKHGESVLSATDFRASWAVV